ncbi:TRAP transporter large permease [Cohaesibacter haloalkalitolerans]|jgi:tripartite ATP-independent transporter DctM subunit|uniref:TRAP transporter large permease n=1 Tax=Cohaesibacter haloalkalitolerans TaxID=1162980 RepID=UPI000E6592A4|nr:TRAP transporter large permease [Cohaesibacter haloalkalitolerans]
MTETMFMILPIWFIAIIVGVPLYLAISLAGTAFIVINGIPALAVPQKIVMAANSFPLLAAPFFILMGNVMNYSGVTTRLFRFVSVISSWMRGGLAHANIIASVVFAGMSGSAVADAGGLGSLEIKAMKDAGYKSDLAVAVTAASATIGPILPPSLPMVIYGVTAEASIGSLFVGAIVPGLLMALALMVTVRAIAKRHNLPRDKFPGLCEVGRAFCDAFFALMTPVILLGGIMSGIFTPTEAAVVAAAYALVVGGFVYRDFSLSDLPQVILSTVQTTGLVMALVMTAGLLGWALSVARIPFMVGSLLADVSHNPLIFLLIVNVSLLIVGLFMEAIAAMLILIPIFVPVAMANGIDPTQFGVLFVLNLMIGTITPPVGVVLFLTASIADVPPERAIRAVIPFLIPLIVVLAAVTCIPSLTTWLPHLLGLGG